MVKLLNWKCMWRYSYVYESIKSHIQKLVYLHAYIYRQIFSMSSLFLSSNMENLIHMHMLPFQPLYMLENLGQLVNN